MYGLLLAGAALALTLNAWFPARRWLPLVGPSFLAGWLTAELCYHHAVAYVGLAGLALWWGPLDWVGAAGPVLLLLCAGAMVHLGWEARRAEEAFAEALGAPLPAANDAWWRALVPFLFADARVEELKNLSYGEGRRRRLDIHRPRGGISGAPVLVQVHGGGWAVGHKRQQGRPLLSHFASRGWVCVAINYRLAPRTRLDGQVEDVRAALRWVRAEIAAYGGDPDLVVLTGGSAGAHLASLVALTERARPVQACVPFYGVYDLADRAGAFPHDGLRHLLDLLVLDQPLREDPAAVDALSPIAQVHPDAPPFCVVHGTHDSLAPLAGARAFVEALRGVSRARVVFAELPLAQHAFDVFHSPRTAVALRGVEGFLEPIRRARRSSTRA